MLTTHTPSVVRSIADAIAIKDEVFPAQRDGRVPITSGYGLSTTLALPGL
jgi:hypothetical protein